MNKAYYLDTAPSSSHFGSRTRFPEDEEGHGRRAAPVAPGATKPRTLAEAPVRRRGRSAAPSAALRRLCRAHPDSGPGGDRHAWRLAPPIIAHRNDDVHCEM